MQVPLPTKVKTEPLMPEEVQTVGVPERERHGQAGRGRGRRGVGCAADGGRPRCRRCEGDRLVALGDGEGLLHLGCGVVRAVPGLVGVEDAGAGCLEAHHTASDGADAELDASAVIVTAKPEVAVAVGV